jgi:hypothetical protein
MEKELYYYIRGVHNEPEITVCVIIGERGYYRGVAICSLLDQPVKEVGRTLAQMRACRAQNRHMAGKQLKNEPINFLSSRKLSFLVMDKLEESGILAKSTINTFKDLTKYEKKLVIANSNMVKIDCEFIPAQDTHVPVQMVGV